MPSEFDAAAWAALSAMLDEVLQLPLDQRQAWLDALAARNPQQHANLLRLLAAEKGAAESAFLESPAVARAVEDGAPGTAGDASLDAGEASTRRPDSAAASTQRIGPYRLLQRLGEGGMGEVWLAEQTAPVQRRVALKLIKAGMDTRQVIARFEAERQALAVMDHPAIAKVFDAGETPAGRPYFVMEYVKGESITAYCDRQRLTTAQRIALFLKVCDGVQHAHQKGIIHRDLKPSNILVETRDDAALPRIIDFGVAKATGLRLTEKTLVTELGAMIGTPEYMSPEQAEIGATDIDTRTDVYSLGVLLYELLVGALPFDSRELRRAAFDELRRLIREVDPPRPSARLTAPGVATSESAKNRRTEPGRLASVLRGDLDWITMKALEKDRARRYGSPAEFAADLTRHLENLPVTAGPPRVTYRARKFVRRHRVGVGLAALAVLSLIAFAVAMGLQSARIARERDRALRAEKAAQEQAETAEQVSKFLRELFNVSDPAESRGTTLTVREILDRGAERLDKELAGQPAIHARLLGTLGGVYQRLGEFEPALRLDQRAVAVRRSALPDDKTGLAKAIGDLAWLYYVRNDFEKSLPLAREALALQEAAGVDDVNTLTSILHTLASILDKSGDHVQAAAVFERSLALREKAFGPESAMTARVLNSLAIVYQSMGDFKRSRSYYERTLATVPKTIGEDHPVALTWLNNFGTLLSDMGDYAEARRVHEKCLTLRERVLGPNHHWVAQSLQNLASCAVELDRPQDAVPLARRAIGIYRKTFGADSLDEADVSGVLADALIATGKTREASDVLTRVIKTCEHHPGNGDLTLGSALASVARIEIQEHRFSGAQEHLTRALALREKTDGRTSWVYADVLATMARLRVAEGRAEAASPLYDEAVHTLTARLGEAHPHTLAAMADWATALRGLGQEDRAHDLEARVRAARTAKH